MSDPITRKEQYYAKMAGEDVNIPAPITREEQFLSAAAGNEINLPTPITREEMYLAKAAGVNINITMLDPITRKERYLHALAEGGGSGGGGGGSSVEVEALTVTQNGEYSEDGVAYSPVTVDVPNSYSAGDEGKVVSNGALVAQSSDTVTENDTYDTTLINSLTVNVSGGGGGDVATGTITFTAAQSTAPATPADKVKITHNLGRVPVGVAWMIETTDEANIGGSQFDKTIQGSYLTGAELMTSTNYIVVKNSSSSANTVNKMTWPWNGVAGASSVFASLEGDTTTCWLFLASASRATGTIPANTTIRWFVW